MNKCRSARRVLLLAAVLALAGAAAPAFAQAEKRKFADLCAISLDGPWLLVQVNAARLPPEGGEFDLEELPGKTTVHWGPASYFSLTRYGGEPKKTYSFTDIHLSAGSLLMQHEDLHIPSNTSRHFILVQTWADQGPDGSVTADLRAGQVRLRYRDGKRSLPMQEVQAADFRRLRLEYPDVVDRFLRPWLASVRAEGVLVPDETALRQVLLDPPDDEALKAKVDRLVAQLDAQDYREREDAKAQLKALLPAAAPRLQSLDRTRLSAEQRDSIDRLLARFQPLSPAQVRALRACVHFLLDALLSEDAAVRAAALARLKERTGKDIALDAGLPAAGRAAAVAALRDKLAPP